MTALDCSRYVNWRRGEANNFIDWDVGWTEQYIVEQKCDDHKDRDETQGGYSDK